MDLHTLLFSVLNVCRFFKSVLQISPWQQGHGSWRNRKHSFTQLSTGCEAKVHVCTSAVIHQFFFRCRCVFFFIWFMRVGQQRWWGKWGRSWKKLKGRRWNQEKQNNGCRSLSWGFMVMLEERRLQIDLPESWEVDRRSTGVTRLDMLSAKTDDVYRNRRRKQQAKTDIFIRVFATFTWIAAVEILPLDQQQESMKAL